MGDVLSTHLDDARRQHIAGEDRSAPSRPRAPRGTPGHASVLAGRRWGVPRVKAWGGAGASQTLTLPPNLLSPGLDGLSRPFSVLPSPFEEPRTRFSTGTCSSWSTVWPEPCSDTLNRVAEGSDPHFPSNVPSLISTLDSAPHSQSFLTPPHPAPP